MSIALVVLAFAPGLAFGFDERLAPFEVAFDGDPIPYATFSAMTLPAREVVITFPGAGASDGFRITSASGLAIPAPAAGCTWNAGAVPAHDVLTITNGGGDTVVVNLFTLAPLTSVENGKLNGFRIGQYPKDRYRGLDSYAPPEGFIEVTHANRSTLVSPHFRLEQFLCKQPDDYPKYLALRPGLLHKLEVILREANNAGIACESFVVMSGFRSPFYNRGINGKKYSRHMWGGAADIYVDVNPKDGIMDDLNGDGVLSRSDAVVLYKLVDALTPKKWYTPLVGGLGSYGKTSAHGPFVHVDVRGFRARW